MLQTESSTGLIGLLANVMTQALDNRAMATCSGPGGLSILAYPLERNALIVGIGYTKDQSHRAKPDRILQQRSLNPAVIGQWFASIFSDQSFYMIKRIDHAEGANAKNACTADELTYLQEILS